MAVSRTASVRLHWSSDPKQTSPPTQLAAPDGFARLAGPMDGLLHPPPAYATWGAFASAHTPAEWEAWVAKGTLEYVSALRAGFLCACGARVKQQLLSPASATAAPKAAATVDLTLDDESDGGASEVEFSVRATTISCACGGALCAACGHQILPCGSQLGAAVDLADQGPADHLGRCGLATVHATAVAIERLRRLYTNSDPAVVAATAVATAPAPSPASAVLPGGGFSSPSTIMLQAMGMPSE